MRSSPIKVETHFIKSGYYQTRKLSGWGVSSEGMHETLQVSITMPTEEEISAYKRMVIEVEPEKGVSVMSWAPCTPGGSEYKCRQLERHLSCGQQLVVLAKSWGPLHHLPP